MVHRCLVCQIDSSRARCSGWDISFHSFPKDEAVAAQWIKFCGFEEHEIYKSNRICSQHFIQDDFIDNRAGGGHRVLKKGRIPSVTKKRSSVTKAHAQNSQSQLPEINNPLPDILNNPSVKSEQGVQNLLKSNSDSTDCFVTVKLEVESFEEIQQADVPSSVTKSSENDLKPRLALDEQFDGCVSPDSSDLNTFENTTPTKRIFSEPRYVGDIRPTDVETPEGAKKSLELAMSTINKQRKKIKCLQDKNRRLLKKAKSLKDSLQRLRKEDLVAEEADDLMLI